MKKEYWILGIILPAFLLYSDFGKAQQRSDQFRQDNRRGRDSGFMSQYSLILDRNVFTRNRGRKEPDIPRVERNVPPPPPIQKSYVLIGISRWGEEYIAFVENNRYGDTQMYRIGNPVAEMKIKRITLDSIELEKGTKTITIQIGSDLTGGAQTSPLTIQELIDRAEGAGPSISASERIETSTTGTADTDDVLKKLMERRKKELEQ